MKTATIARRLRSDIYCLEASYGVTPDSVLGRSLESVARHLDSLANLESSAAPSQGGSPKAAGSVPGGALRGHQPGTTPSEGS
jgi:hypothetical protein